MSWRTPIASVGLGIAFYYGLTGFACVWYFRKVLTRSAADFLLKGVLPLLGALMLLYFFCYAAFSVYADPEYGTTVIDLPWLGDTGGVSVIGIGALVHRRHPDAHSAGSAGLLVPQPRRARQRRLQVPHPVSPIWPPQRDTRRRAATSCIRLVSHP